MFILFVFVFSFLDQASAQPFLSCQVEKNKFCKDQTEFSEVLQCLIKHDADLSNACKQELERMIQARKEASSRGGGALTSFGGPNAMGPPIPMMSYEGRYMPGEKGPDLNEHKFNISTPVFQNQNDSLALSLAAGQLHLGESLRLNTGKEVPNTLTRMEIGTQYSHKLQNRKNWGIRASMGYAGDRPGNSSKDNSYSLSASYGYPSSENPSGYWLLMVFIANNSPFINYLPLPGVVYMYRTPTLTGMFGFPITSVQWTPVNPWIYSLSIFGPTLQTEVAYGHRDAIQYFGGYSFIQQSFIPSVREEDRDRLKLQEQRLAAGFRMPLSMSMLGELQAGRSFGRSMYVGKKFFDKDKGSVSLDDDWFALWSLKVLF